MPKLAAVLTLDSTYTVGVSVEVGMDLGLDIDEIISAGVSVSVSNSEETGVSQGAQKGCPDGPWYCALIITPQVAHVTGTYAKWQESSCSDINPSPYTVDLPTMASNGLPTGAAVDICACPNFAHWADAGAPSIICPGPCVL